MTTSAALEPHPTRDHHRVQQLPDPPRPPDAMYQFPHVTTAFYILDDHFRERPDVLVSGEGYLRRDASDSAGWVNPDCVVAFGVDPASIRNRNGYVISEVGKPPDFVLEVASASTGRADYTTKRDIYAQYGVVEYWRFDATGGEYHDAALAGDRLVEGVYEPITIQRELGGQVWGRSPTLGLDLCWEFGELRFFDPRTGEYLPGLAEAKSQRDAAVVERDAALVEARRLRERIRRILP